MSSSSLPLAARGLAILVVAMILPIDLFGAASQNFRGAPDSAKQMQNPFDGSAGIQAGKPLYHLRCARCHGEKVGPFAFEHAPVRLEGCSACHQPHGSANPRMLTRPVVSQLCLECHANLPTPAPSLKSTFGTVPPAFHDLRLPRFQNCTICHQKIHGSYVNRAFTK